jgi:hypothetical protein
MDQSRHFIHKQISKSMNMGFGMRDPSLSTPQAPLGKLIYDLHAQLWEE